MLITHPIIDIGVKLKLATPKFKLYKSKGGLSMKKQKKDKKAINTGKKDKYIRLLKLTEDLTDIEIEKVKDFVSSLKSQRIQ